MCTLFPHDLDDDATPAASAEHPYEQLTPEVIMAAVESVGGFCDGRILALNSYENRVYQVGMEGAAPLIAKFYRPQRWSDAAIEEEHAFAHELFAEEIPVVPPLRFDGVSLLRHDGFRFALFERRGGRWPELGTQQEREWMGRFIGRIHMVGRRREFEHRECIEIQRMGDDARDYLLKQQWIPDHLRPAYESVSADLLDIISDVFMAADSVTGIRLHGDCHRGNVLWTDDGPHFVDLDDCVMGPAVQDLWMLLAGTPAEMGEQLKRLLEGYERFSPFNRRELALVECLRSLRMIHYSAWLARRWNDPAFPAAFPWFAEARYWENQILALREQMAAIEEGPLSWS